jgi:hypothetical protein
MDVNKTQQSFRTHFYCSLDPWDFLITFPSTFNMACLILRFKPSLLDGATVLCLCPNAKVFSRCPPKKIWSLSKDYWLEALTHLTQQATGDMFQTTQNRDSIKFASERFYWALMIFGMFWNRIFAPHVFWVRVPRWFCKDYIQQIDEYEY